MCNLIECVFVFTLKIKFVLKRAICAVGIDIDAGCGQLKADLIRKRNANATTNIELVEME